MMLRKEIINWQMMVTAFFTIIFTVGLFLAGQTTCFATSVALQWDAVTDPALAGYKVYYQTDSSVQPFTGTGSTQGNSPVDVHNLTATTIGGLDPAHSYYFAVTAYSASGTESAYSNVVFLPERVSPTVSFSFPANNSMVSGTVSVTASASDNVGVTKVEFYVNGTLAASDTSTPFLYSWNTSSLAAGTYTLTAKAYDAAGNVGQSGNVSVTVVKDTTAPTISLTAPGSNATVSGTVAITASASDNVGVSKVEFYVNGVLLSATNVTPYRFTWNTTTVANGGYTLIAKAYDNTGNVGTSSSVAVTVNNIATPRVNVALAANGSVASASTYYNSAYPPSAVNDGDRNGINWGAGGGWVDATSGTFPDWIQITFNGQKTISEIDVFTTQDNYQNPVDPTSTMGFTMYGLTAFTVQYWNGTSWVTVPGGNISGNTLVWRQITFSSVTTDQIRITVNSSKDSMWSHVTEIEAYSTGVVASDTTAPTVSLTAPSSGATVSGTVAITASASDNVGVSKVEYYVNNVLQTTVTSSPYTYSWNTTTVANGGYTLIAKAYDNTGNVGTSSSVAVTVNNIATPRVNVALAANGGVASASTYYNSAYPPSAVNDGDRKGINWGAGGGWVDATSGTFPDWIQITFNGQKTISEIDVFTTQDNYQNPVDPTSTMGFTMYGLTAFTVQYWNGTSWVTVPGGNISGNTLVWRQITFSSVTTDQIRITVNSSKDSMWSHVTEIEAYTSN